jgi:hypothetical protein
MQKTLAITPKVISPVIASATALRINSPATMTESVSFLSQANKYLDSVIAYKKSKTDPINQALRAIRNETRPLELLLIDAITIIKTKQSAYQTQKINAQRAKEQAIADKLSAGTLDINQAVTKLSKINAPDSAIKTEDGSVSFREDNILEIVDASLIPREYLIPDEQAILTSLDKGIAVPGCVYKIVMIPINRRK